jgi:hypothetical protein
MRQNLHQTNLFFLLPSFERLRLRWCCMVNNIKSKQYPLALALQN